MAVEAFMRLAVPYTDEDEISEIRGVLDSGYLTQGIKVAEFECSVAGYVGSKYALATTSATTALHLSLVALDVGPGDEVLIPDFTFPATANVVIQQGARPVPVDIDLETFTIDVIDMAEKITPRSKAVIPVHAFGLSADMDPIMELAQKRGLAVVEDAACALGATYYGKPCGSLAATGCFSFHPRKVITTGEGGMITTDDDLLAEKIQLLRNHGGARREGRFIFEAAGYNYRMSDILAAVGVAQMRKLDALIGSKRELAAQLTERLEGIDGAKPPRAPAWRGHIYQSYVIRLDESIDRDRVIGLMRQRGIETTLGTYALHAQPFFARQYNCRPGDLPNSYRAYRQSLAVPLYPPMDELDLERISRTLRWAVESEG